MELSPHQSIQMVLRLPISLSDGSIFSCFSLRVLAARSWFDVRDILYASDVISLPALRVSPLAFFGSVSPVLILDSSSDTLPIEGHLYLLSEAVFCEY